MLQSVSRTMKFGRSETKLRIKRFMLITFLKRFLTSGTAIGDSN